MARGDGHFCGSGLPRGSHHPLPANRVRSPAINCRLDCCRGGLPETQRPWPGKVDRGSFRNVGCGDLSRHGDCSRGAALLRRPEVKYIFKSGSVEDLGGKGYGLARLQQEGFNVPEWFAVSPRGFEDSLNESQKSAFQSGDTQKIRCALESLLIDSGVRREVELALGDLSHNSDGFAVRSSALDEDACDCSCAGQFESCLSVPAGAVPEKIAAVWRSGFSERVSAYRSQYGRASQAQKAPAVIIQRMINPEAAGVAFSADPVTGRTGTVVISAVQGLASGLVSGETDSDDYELDRNGKVTRRQRLV